MVQYRYALDSNDRLVVADDLRGQENADALRCISCNQPMIARVNGKIHRPHFAHKTQAECNGETYLHQLGKRAFVETYKKCLEEGRPFTISVPTPRQCTRFRGLATCFSKLEGCKREYDLTSYYSDIGVECIDGAFVPDVILRSKNRPLDKIYIEIAVTHFLSEAKEHSDNKIIEIPISSEEDVDHIRCGRITSENAVFIGFAPTPGIIPHDQCLCASKSVNCFYVYTSGKAFLEKAPLSDIQIKITKLKTQISYHNIFLDYNDAKEWGVTLREIGAFESIRGKLFTEEVRLASERGAPIKNCFLCRYHGDNRGGKMEQSIYCKTYQKPCSSGEASQCDRYRPEL